MQSFSETMKAKEVKQSENELVYRCGTALTLIEHKPL